MAATEQGVWGLQDVRDKQLQSEWSYDGGRELYMAGNAVYGVLGQNQSNQTYSSPKQVGTNVNWRQGDLHSDGNTAGATKTDGTMWIWGNNAMGKLGLNQRNPNSPIPSGKVPGISSPAQLPGTDWNQIAMSYSSCFASKTDGTIWGWGENYGKLGLNQGTTGQPLGWPKSSPVQIGTDSDWSIVVSSATGCTFGVKSAGTLWAWGDNQYGELSKNNTTPYSSPTQVGADSTWSTDINLWGVGGHQIFAIKTDATLWAWGIDSFGELGLNNKGQSQSSPCQIPGTYTSVGATGMGASAIKADGTLWGWGRNQNGQLGQGGTGLSSSRSSPVQMGTDTDWVRVAKGYARQTGAVKSDGSYYNCGSGDRGSLGHDNTSDRSTLTQLPGIYTQDYRQIQDDQGMWIKEL